MSTLRTLELTKSYSGRTVVRRVSIGVASGEIVGLLGPNGAGKTTTFYMTVGLTAPDSGRVALDGVELPGEPVYVGARAGLGDGPRGPGTAWTCGARTPRPSRCMSARVKVWDTCRRSRRSFAASPSSRTSWR